MADTPISLVEWIEPITDRSQTDVNRLQYLLSIRYDKLNDAQKQELAQDSKGALNKSDLVRILNDIILLYESLGFTHLKHLMPNVGVVPRVGLVPGAVEFEESDTGWYRSVPEIPTVSFYNQLLDAVSRLRATLYIYPYTPTVPSHPLNTFEKWNDIEQILKDMRTLIRIIDYPRAGNEIYAGQGIGVL